ncbi:DUF6443 domain-containing protein [uncultured Acetobacteroides sp.]|uniref:DUF6443 domain-containing protein n=1 Tax=uncultured Acetobacteroides sp. TaxID=1760811 RepID=UPI0029F583AB|nr:DUF6443 domain-containing protein [uncultured Acetobacteroides sp.]
MKNIFISTIAIILFSGNVYAQQVISPTSGKNYRISQAPLDSVKTLQELQNLPAQKQGATIEYLNGLGQLEQTIGIGAIATPRGYRNMVQPHVYDAQGREYRQYLPYSTSMDAAIGGYRSGVLTEQASFYQSLYPGQTPYSEITFDGSPLSRPVSQTRLGNPNGQAAAPDPTVKDYAKYVVGANSANQIRMWKVDDDGALIPKGYYPEATLYLSENTDADGRKSRHYVDLQGRTICTIADPNGINATTQYVYDDYGMLRWVLPPKFNAESNSASMSDAAIKVTSATDLTGVNSNSYVVMGAGSLSLKPDFVGVEGFSASTIGYTQTTLDAIAFYYEYDNDGRLIKKKAPGMAPIYYAYDGRDRLVAVQDGNQRKQGQWLYYRYDELNRNIESGLLANSVTDQASMQARIDAAYKSGGYAWFDKESGVAYTTTSYPKPTTDGTLTPLCYIWYDYYPTGAPTFDRTKAYADSSSRVLGRITQVKVRTIDDIPYQTASWSTKAIYYDADGQAIQGVSDGSILGNSAKMTVSSKLGWRGQLQEVTETQTFGTITTTMLRTYSYYDNGVLKSLAASYNGGATTTLASYTYDDLGHVREKLIGNASQSQRYAYNIRGWLAQINDPNSAAGSDLFALKLAYETPEAGATAAAQYAGNISSATWQSRTSATTAAPKKTYGYTYDALNRLTASDFVGGSSGTSLEEKDITYDLNGNILTLNRTDAAGAATRYSYSYNGNQLATVTSSKSGSYTYDDNGNMITDGRKGMNFTYNTLNMISTVASGASVLRNLYDATGTRLATVNPDGSTTYYHGSMVYAKPASGAVALKYALHNEGMVTANGTYQYLLKDNQGNTRVAYTNVAGQVQVVQSTDYYPYGMPHGVMNADKNPYLYTGKELQNPYVGAQPLNLMDYGARYYDYELGRWHSMDPLAEESYGASPYCMTLGNPIGFFDLNGLKPVWNGEYGDGCRYIDDQNGKEYTWDEVCNFYDFGGDGGGAAGEVTETGGGSTISCPNGVDIVWVEGSYTHAWIRQDNWTCHQYITTGYTPGHYEFVPRQGNVTNSDISGWTASLQGGNLEGQIPTYFVHESITPEIYKNTELALSVHPEWSILTYNGGGKETQRNRYRATGKKMCSSKLYSRDEFPYASTKEGGYGAFVNCVRVEEQRIQGGALSSFYRGMKAGDIFHVVLIPDLTKHLKMAPVSEPHVFPIFVAPAMEFLELLLLL